MEVLGNRLDVIPFVKSIAEDEGMQKPVITDVKTNKKGEGYLGEIFRITVKEDSSDKKLHLIVKAAFTDDKARKFVPIRQCFLNEIYFYTQIEPEFQKIGAVRGIPHIELFPKCYRMISENQKETLCLQNLDELSFKTFDKTHTLDDEHMSLIFKTYGQFHAYSYAFKDQEPQEYNRIVGKMYNIYEEFLNNPDGAFKPYLKSYNTLIGKCLVPGVDNEIIEKCKKYLGEGIVELFYKAVTEQDAYATILHGDCWSNNMLFKYEAIKNSNKPVDIRLIDMQIVKVGSPACDLSYCLYSSASKTLFDNLEKYLEIYYSSFSSFLKLLGSDPEKVFPFNVLKEHWKKYAVFGMVMSLQVIKLHKCTKAEDFVGLKDEFEESLDDDNVVDMKFDHEEFNIKAKELLYHLSAIDVL